MSPTLNGKFLTIGPPENSQISIFLNKSSQSSLSPAHYLISLCLPHSQNSWNNLLYFQSGFHFPFIGTVLNQILITAMSRNPIYNCTSLLDFAHSFLTHSLPSTSGHSHSRFFFPCYSGYSFCLLSRLFLLHQAIKYLGVPEGSAEALSSSPRIIVSWEISSGLQLKLSIL